ncbi:MAG TPA: serine/threonine-protein kinase [Isosphaeraceae bacterium]|nr:serine/threonine-protein kinase [Isosphaeraceae bacterium]
MTATAEDLPNVDLNDHNRMGETVAYEPKTSSNSGPLAPSGSSDMPKANYTPQVHGRYTFGSGARPLDGYTIKRAIGRGGFGEVYYATSDSGKEVALKLILRNLDVERRGVVQCMNLKCPNLLTIFDLKSNDADDTFVIMEYVAGPSLASVLKQYPAGLPEAEVRNWLKGLVEGVAYLHDHGIVHRDLKPANLFMEEGIVKIGDYGLAKLITPSQGTEHSESIGTCHYMAPEIGSGKYHKPIDIYAMGVILYEMLTGRVPFEGETVNEVLMKHLTARPDVSVLPKPYQAIVAKALAKDPNHRVAKVYDLLAPGDAPRTPDVRIIGDGKAGPGAGTRLADGTAVRAAQEDDILRIEAEEPIFYIGPDTRPPGAAGRNAIAQRLRANWAALRRPARYQSPPPSPGRNRPVTAQASPVHGGAVRQAAYASPASKQPIRKVAAPPPEPPPLGSGRVRTAELAASMLWSAPLVALLIIPAATILGIDLSNDPQQLAVLYGMALLGTWTTLVPNKLFEARKIDGTNRRLLAMAAGLLLGGVSLALGRLLQLDFAPQTAFFDNSRNLGPVYFGALYAVMSGWSSLVARDRVTRFRILPIVGTGLVAAALIPFWPHTRQDGIAVAVLIATAVQLVSPWNEAASLYARYVRACEKQRRTGQVV